MVNAASCAIEVQNGMVERNVGLPPDRRIDFHIGIHVGDVVEESDGDLMGESVNIFRECRGFTRARAQTPWRRRACSSKRPRISILQTSTH